MTDRLPDTWTAIEGRVLLDVARRMTEQPGTWVGADTVARELDLPRVQVADALHALTADGLFGEVSGGDIESRVDVKGLTPAGRRRVGRWPDSREAAQLALLGALDRLVEAAESPEDRTRLQRLRDAAGGLSKDTLTAVVGAVAATAATGAM